MNSRFEVRRFGLNSRTELTAEDLALGFKLQKRRENITGRQRKLCTQLLGRRWAGALHPPLDYGMDSLISLRRRDDFIFDRRGHGSIRKHGHHICDLLRCRPTSNLELLAPARPKRHLTRPARARRDAL